MSAMEETPNMPAEGTPRKRRRLDDLGPKMITEQFIGTSGAAGIRDLADDQLPGNEITMETFEAMGEDREDEWCNGIVVAQRRETVRAGKTIQLVTTQVVVAVNREDEGNEHIVYKLRVRYDFRGGALPVIFDHDEPGELSHPDLIEETEGTLKDAFVGFYKHRCCGQRTVTYVPNEKRTMDVFWTSLKRIARCNLPCLKRVDAAGECCKACALNRTFQSA